MYVISVQLENIFTKCERLENILTIYNARLRSGYFIRMDTNSNTYIYMCTTMV